MGELVRKLDWSATPLGPVQQWPQSLRTSVGICLESRFPILLWWGPGMVMIYNDAYLPILGAKHPRSLGAAGREVWPEIWEIIGPMLEGVLSRAEATWSENQLLLLERRGFAEECYFTFSYSPIRDESGGVGGIFCAVTETTGQVLGERRLRVLRDVSARTSDAKLAKDACARAAEALSDDAEDLPFALIYLLDADGRHAELAGWAGLEPGGPASLEAVDLAREVDPWRFRDALRAGTALEVTDLEARFGPFPPRGELLRPESAMVLPFGLSGGTAATGLLVAGLSPRLALDERYRSFLHLVSDYVATAIASARRFQDARERAEALAEIDREKTAFFSNVSHEFRTPLTLILGPLEEALGSRARALRGEDLEATHRNALRLLKLVNSLLDFARIQAGRARASYQPTDLSTLTAGIASAFRSATDRAGLALTVDCPPLEEPVWVDRDMWEKIVLNLVSNAFEFTFEGGIEVSLRRADDEVELRVKDTGVGIPEDELPRLFERFHRVRGTRVRGQEGTGIGLALVRELAKLHGGDISVASTPGEGSTFTVKVPLGRSHLPAERVGEAARSPSEVGSMPFVQEARGWTAERTTPSAPTLGSVGPRVSAASSEASSARILVADDNADMRAYLRRLLAPRWTVELAADGTSALEQARAHPPALLLTDVMMPGLDGFALLKAMREDERTRAVPVVMLSARAGEEARLEGLQAGADDYLVKPFSARELLARVESRLEISRLRAATEAERVKLHDLFMRAPAIICVLRGPEHVFDLANPLYARLVGRSEGELVGRPIREALPEIAGQGYFEILDEVFRTGRPHTHQEALVRLDRTGTGRLEDVFLNFVYQPSFDDEGQPNGILVFAFDVTEQVRTIRFSELFVGILGHDLRNPLSAINMAAGLLLKRGGAVEALVKPAQRILNSGRRMGEMIDQLLDFTRARIGGGIPLERHRVDLARICRESIEELTGAADGAAIRFSADGNPLGEWDPARLAQVLSNLLGNALTHRATGSEVALRLDGTAPERVRVEVRNPGTIPPELLPELFEPFRTGTRPRGGSGGLGLGLFITKQIVLAHGGRIEVRSSEPEGTCFVVELPREHASTGAVRDDDGSRPRALADVAQPATRFSQ